MAELGGLAEVLEKRNAHASKSYGNPYWLIESINGAIVDFSAFEPDSNTHRGDFYYNTIENVLYKKINVAGGLKVWKRIGS